MAKMSSSKLDVVWSPVHNNKFVIWGSDISLYEVARLQEIDKKSSFLQISSSRGATLLASQSATTVRSVDLSAIPGLSDPLLALGHSSGKVSLTTLRQVPDHLGVIGREFVPRYTRLCNSVSWNHVEPSLLACAMDKHRSDHCVLVWDVTRANTPADGQTGPSSAASAVPATESRPLAEMCLSEPAHSVAWSRAAPRALLASINLKHIKLFDLRDLSNKSVSSTSTRHCYGACADPFSAWRVASRGDSAVCVWDLRHFTKPLLTLSQSKPVVKISWCPTRRNLLLSLSRDASALRLHELHAARETDADTTRDDDDDYTGYCSGESPSGAECARAPSVVERDVSPGALEGPQPLAAFAWHPRHEARLLAVPLAGGAAEHTVCERASVCWGARGGLVWAAGAELRAARDHAHAHAHGADVAYVMRRRAHTDYGLKPDLWQNADLADDETLNVLWHFLALSKSLVEDGCIRSSPSKHPGVLSVLRPPGEGYRSEIVPSILPDLPNRRVTMYRSSERSRALQLCGWGWGWENAMAGVERLEAEGTPCRAAAVAIFHLRLRAAVDVLSRAKDPGLRVASLALAGLSDERVWRDALPSAADAMPDAYLRAALHFLAGAISSAQGVQPATLDVGRVLDETEMRVEDRVAFACTYLADGPLYEYVRRAADELVEQGDLSGMLLTGGTAEGVTLLQRWVERSGDVQTAALVAARCLPAELLRDPSVAQWIDSYREILDRWQLWWSRCALDTWANAALAGGGGGGGVAGGVGGGGGVGAVGAGGGGAERRVGVACTYCGKCVAAPPGATRPRPAFARLPPPAAKMKQISACPNCRKPLPRCGVCLLHLGTDAGGAGAGACAGAAGGAPFAAWFTWCATCRHGGHAHHMTEWFREHVECPVSSCNCRCYLLDPPDRGAPA